MSLYTVSMDHCPSEQLSPNADDWHTTALILSPRMQHSAFAHSLASQLCPKTKQLRKWKKASKIYRKTFLEVFINELAAHSSVYAFALSARSSAIRQSMNHFIEEFGLQDRFHRIEAGRISFGPFVRMPDGESVTVTLSENRAVMCLFVAYFVLRMQLRMFEAANAANQECVCHVNWNFLADKFPGPLGDDMDLLFRILINRDRSRGRIIWGYFEEGGRVETDLLVDNLVGALNSALTHTKQSVPTSIFTQTSGLFYWENGILTLPLDRLKPI